jgi:hypothetical protein
MLHSDPLYVLFNATAASYSEAIPQRKLIPHRKPGSLRNPCHSRSGVPDLPGVHHTWGFGPTWPLQAAAEAGVGIIVISLVELRGFEPLTPTLPGPGRSRDQGRYVHFGPVGDVVEGPGVVTVVVRTVVISQL